ncbi:MAG TPA: prepilin-type N-terminal cleavage/methylation domain-containing protein, partial [Candidatus Acidoferrales bacterium]|nr:prepilin-type N-terminal cleavage/methylation domain-containing protein [Candidatus Acidoferrales bacterium]
EKGFSLIELLIVVAIILIIAAIAIPNLIRARIAANQSSAASSLRTIASASAMYQSTYQNGYPVNLAMIGPTNGALATCTLAGLIDQNLAVAQQKSGYNFAWTAGQVQSPAGACGTQGFTDGFAVVANPVSASTGTIGYCVDETNVIMQSNAPPIAANAANPGAGIGPTCPPAGNGVTPIGN